MKNYINKQESLFIIIISSLLIVLLIFPSKVLGGCTCDQEQKQEESGNGNGNGRSRSEALKYKFVAIASIFTASLTGVCLPILGKKIPYLSPENNFFFIIKAFAAGVILATGFIHVLPDAFESLTSPCLNENPWGSFPFAGFVAMVSAIATLMVDVYATSHYTTNLSSSSDPILKTNTAAANSTTVRSVDSDEETRVVVVDDGNDGGGGGVVTIDGDGGGGFSSVVRYRVISQVLELGIIVHSVIIGIGLGASNSTKTIRPLLAALTFHQFFEGIGLGGCISQAKFKGSVITVMSVCFSLTAPIGIAIGIGISNIYDENSPNALIVQGIFDSASAGILIYMALVDLLAADFMNPRLQSNGKLQLGANVSLLLGAASMSILAKWA